MNPILDVISYLGIAKVFTDKINGKETIIDKNKEYMDEQAKIWQEQHPITYKSTKK